jgi:hypothetical protein
MSIRGLMIAVVLAGLFFSLVAWLGRLNQAMNYHGEQVRKAAASRSKSPPSGPTLLETWHSMKMSEYRATFERVDLSTFLLLVSCVSLAAVAALGRVLNWFFRPSLIPTGVEPHRSP